LSPLATSQLSLWNLEPPPEADSPAPNAAEHTSRAAAPTSDAELSALFLRVFRRLDIARPEPRFDAAYRPFTGLRSTIRLRHGRVEARVSDLLIGAPAAAVEALAEILLAQLYRLRPSAEARQCYRAYVTQPELRGKLEQTRRERGVKRLLPPRGRYFNLQLIFEDLNARFFSGKLSPVRIGWSPHRSRTVLGHYDSAHRTITISRAFDSPSVPGYLLEYLVYHEMLHVRHPVERNGSRRVIHSPAFVADEKRFPDYERAIRRLRRLSGRVD
jgi:hypothetical protein